jgi:uncharacterized membrane protein
MERVLLKSFAIIFFVLLSTEVYAINLGSIVKNDFAQTTNYESVKFKMLFWNVESESYTLKLTVKEAPEDWTVIIDPDEFVLNNSVGEEYIKLPYMNENTRAKVVNLFVKPDLNSKAGNYSVFVEAETKTSDETSGIEIVPQRLMKFVIDLRGIETSDEVDSNIPPEGNNQNESENSELISTGEDIENNSYFYFIVLFLVIIASIILYKKY